MNNTLSKIVQSAAGLLNFIAPAKLRTLTATGFLLFAGSQATRAADVYFAGHVSTTAGGGAGSVTIEVRTHYELYADFFNFFVASYDVPYYPVTDGNGNWSLYLPDPSNGHFENIYAPSVKVWGNGGYMTDPTIYYNVGNGNGGLNFVAPLPFGAAKPNVLTSGATGVSTTAGTMNGVINPDAAGSPRWDFAYGTDPNLGSYATVPSPTPAPGAAADFSGNGDYMQAPAAAYFTGGDYTMEGWVYLRSYNNWSRMFDFGNGPGNANVLLAVTASSSGYPAMHVYNSSGANLIAIQSTVQLPLNQWVHLAGVRTGNTGLIYMNGTEVARGTFSGAPDNVTRNNNYIGRSNWGPDAYANGLFDDLRIWNIARSAADIANDRFKNMSGNASCIANWRFDEANGSATALDSAAAGGAQNGTFWYNGVADTNARTDNSIAGPGLAPVEYASSYSLTGLTPDTTYYYTMQSGSSLGGNNGSITSFTTSIATPSMSVANTTVNEDIGSFSIPVTGIGDNDTSLNATYKLEVIVNNPALATQLTPTITTRARYQYIAGSFSWNEAKRDAVRRGGHLATVTSATENATISSLIGANTAWIGLTDEVTEGTFQWVTGESYPGTFTNWNPGEPNNAGGLEDYVQMYVGGKWNDLPGASRLGYVLEYEDITPSSASYSVVSLPANTTSYNIQFSSIFNQNGSTPVTVRLLAEYADGRVQVNQQTITLTVASQDDVPTVGLGTTLDFDSANSSYLSMPSGAYFTGPFTVESWVYLRSYKSWERLFDFGTGAGTDNVIGALSQGVTGKPVFSIYNGAGHIDLVASDPLPLSAWTHIAFVYDGTQGYIYVNGEVKARGNIGPPTSVNRTFNYIGRSNWGADAYADMRISEFRIWNVARTLEDLALFKSFSLWGNENGLQIYLRGIEGSGPAGALVRDFASDAATQGGAQNATLNGNVTWIAAGTANALPLGSSTVRIPVGEDTIRRIGLPAFDFEVTPLPATAWSIVTPPANGALTAPGNYPGGFQYLPSTNFNGLDQFTYRVTTTNGTGGTVFANYTVYLEITPDNDPPFYFKTIANQNFLESTTNNIAFTVDDNETPVDELFFTLTSSDQGVVPNTGLSVIGSGTNKFLQIRPKPGESGTTHINVRVTDKGAGSFPPASTEFSFDVSFEPLPAFAILDMGTLSTFTESEGTGINDKWEALGNALGNQTLTRSFFWGGPAGGTALKEFAPASGGVSTRGGALNNNSGAWFESITSAGLGSLYFDDGSARTAFVPPAGTTTALRGGLTDLGSVVGSALESGVWHAVRSPAPGTTGTNLITTGYTHSWAFDVSSADLVVGVVSNTTGNVRGYAIDASTGGFTVIPTLAGGTNNYARGVNKGGQVAGSSQTKLVDNTVLDLANGRYLDLPDNVWFSGDFTVEAWVYLRNNANNARLFDFGNGSPVDNVLLATGSGTGKPYFHIYNNTSQSVLNGTAAIPLNTWTHVAVTLAGTTGTIYINGTAAGTGILNVPRNVTRTNNFIGKSNWSVDPAADLLVDNFRIFSNARTSTQIATDKESLDLNGAANLVAQYKLDEGAGSTAKDTGGNNLNGTLIGGSIYSSPNGLAYGPVVTRATLYSQGSTLNLGTLPNGGDSAAFAVNEFGKVVGQAIADGKQNATLYAAGTLQNMNVLVSEEDDNLWHLTEARAINKQGAVVGTGVKGGLRRAYMALPATVVGRKVVRPQGAVTNFAPDIEIIDSKGFGTQPDQFFYWSAGESKLYATRPCIAKLKWYVTTVISTNTDRIEVLTANIWPRNPTIHVVGAPVDLEPKPTNSVFGYTYQQLHYPDGQTLNVVIDASTKTYDAKVPGWSVVRYLRNGNETPDPLKHPAYFEVIRSFAYNDPVVFHDNVPWVVGDTIENLTHFDYGKNGWVFFEKSFYDGDGPDRAYDRPTRSGPIIPVNTDTQYSDDLVVGWYHTNLIGVAWANEAWRYSLSWPEDTTNKIIIASQLGTGELDENIYRRANVYVQPDSSRPGFNPNEEHAFMAPSDVGMAMFALRNDLNSLENFSRPFALLKYKDSNDAWRVKVFKVIAEEDPYFFKYAGTAGKEIQAPYPLRLLPICDDSTYISGPGWEDYHGKIYARAAGQYGEDTNIVIRYFYPLQPTFYSPKKPNSSATYAQGECMPWLDRLPGNTPGVPNNINFNIRWPDDAPVLNIGQTGLKPINGLPDFLNMADAKIIFDDQSLNSGDDLSNLARLYDPLSPRTYKLTGSEKIPDSILRQSVNGKDQFSDLPWSLRIRLKYDPINKWLSFEGYFQPDFDVGDPLLLPNVLTALERDRIKKLSSLPAWGTLIDKLYDLTRNPNQLDANWDGTVDQTLLIGLELVTNTVSMSPGQALVTSLGANPAIKFRQLVQPVDLTGAAVKYRTIRPQQFGAITKGLTAGGNVPSGAARPLKALDFDGVNDSVNAGSGVGLNARSFTVEFWAKRASLAKDSFVVSQGTGADEQGLHIGFRSNDTFTFAFWNDDLNGPAVSDTTTWRHYACTYDTDKNLQIIYIDGREVARRTSNSDFTGTGPLIIGNRLGDLATSFRGQLDELRIWNRALNSFEVQHNMRKKLIGNETSLVLYYHFDEGSGVVLHNVAVANAVGLPATGTLVNGPTWVDSTAPAAIPPRFVTVAENDNPILGALPVGLHVVRVDDGPYSGDVKVLLPDNVFDERLTLRQSPDFGGDPGPLVFEWYYHPATDGTPPALPQLDLDGNVINTRGWIKFNTDPSAGNGVNQITIGEGGESSIITLSDNWFLSRYKGYTINNQQDWSDWVGDPTGKSEKRPVLAEGWIKRVIRGLNPFDQRIANFREASVSTLVSMVSQAGGRYEGDIAFNPSADAINGVGLIEAYETVMRRGKNLSIDGVPAINFAPANNAVLLAATKVADLYTLLGNEAYSDAQDPTIGFGTVASPGQSATYGSLASSIFAFQNQLDSLLEEELVLLRGRDDRAAGTQAAPIYNRLFWNFTLGEGEVAYQQNYNITDQNNDGFIDERDARAMYPQGHGDAWGHYLKALKLHYDLLRHPNFTWVPTTEAVNVAGAAIEVDFLDERKFATTAALKAKTGAEIVDLTYRDKYVEDPDGQWQGYKDTDTDRAWGVTGWARRAAMGAYFDWATANTILPSVDPDPDHEGIEKVDRTTVAELKEIATAHDDIQARLDMADAGLNPLGLARGVVPFDIDPGQVTAGKTHFEQVADRALKAMNNAIATWNEANSANNLLRQNQDTLERFKSNIEDQERDYKNRLIETFGYPYAGDIGPGKTYPNNYDGPDLYHYNYVATTELNNDTAPASASFKAYFTKANYGLKSSGNTQSGALGKADENFYFPSDIQGDISDRLSQDVMVVDMPFTTADWGFRAPTEWGQRRAPGEIQVALGEMIQQEAAVKEANLRYSNLLKDIDSQMSTINQRYQVRADELKNQNDVTNVKISMGVTIAALKGVAKFLTSTIDDIKAANQVMYEGSPKVVGFATDAFAPFRGAITGILNAGTKALSIGAVAANAGVDLAQAGIEAAEGVAQFNIEKSQFNYEVAQQISQLETLMNQEAVLRVECFREVQAMRAAFDRYKQALAKGQRLIEERLAFRQRTAGDISNYRYSDMTFRIFRNDALQKYRAQFDLAQRYVFLAATAYDYEVNLLGTDSRAGQSFLTDIIRQRALGQMRDGVPIAGPPGLADPLARLTENFGVLKTQLGFNNPQTETGRFSLRNEFYRLKDSSAADWRSELKKSRVSNLWDVPEFRRFCRPFAPESAGAQPGLVIRFATSINFGKNFFGKPLSGGDSAYDPSRFATKAHSVGVWFSGYNGNGMSVTPRVYLIPVGVDILRSPTGNDLVTRQWRVLDQALPVPFTIGSSQLNSDSYIPMVGSLGGSFADIRRFASFRGYHDSGSFTESEAVTDSRLIGRSVWNTEWMLVIPGGTLLSNANSGLDAFIASVTDVKLFFQTYSYSGN